MCRGCCFDWEHNRLGCTVLEQAKEIDDALTKGGDKESSSAQSGKAKYVG